jgi:predicted negative regulator of RcsB-dependent stress response
MDKQHRRDLKTDKFAEEVFDVFDWATHHRDTLVRYGAIVLVVILVAVGAYSYVRYQASERQSALAAATRVDDATVGPNAQAGIQNFTTQEEKEKAVSKAYTEVASKYAGSDEGAVARLRLASLAVDKGNLPEAEKLYKAIVEDAPAGYAALARLSLAQVYAAENKTSDAEKVLRAAMDKPTSTVSREQAAIALGELLVKSNPAEAKKLLEPLRTSSRVAVSQAAVTAFANLPDDLKKDAPKKDDAKK